MKTIVFLTTLTILGLAGAAGAQCSYGAAKQTVAETPLPVLTPLTTDTTADS